MNQRVLFVDDEPKLLAALKRHLGEQFDITTATGGVAALDMLSASHPFAVVVSDMRMPGMNGIDFLGEAKKRLPNTVRIMLTGCAEFQIAVDAVNEGNIFRFLAKPCQPETLAKAVQAGLEQYRLVTAEKELIEKTLSGSVKVLTDVLALVNPAAFGRASRVRRIVRQVAAELKLEKAWMVDLAAMLSQIGCVTLPASVMDKLYGGKTLSSDETRMLERHPTVGRDLVAHIPRLEGVAAIIAHQNTRLDQCASTAGAPSIADIPIGARILKLALDYDTLTTGGMSGIEAICRLRARKEWYDPAILDALCAVGGTEDSYEIREVAILDLAGNMILAEDVRTVTDVLLVCKGNEVSPTLRERLRNYAYNGLIQEPIRVLVKGGGAHTAAPVESLNWSASTIVDP
jgi:response regulator RpfG family c-di-GMP phosphodiesterase